MFNYKDTGADKVFNVINIIIITLIFLIVLYPLIYIVSASFSSAYEVMNGNVWLFPKQFTLEGYKAVFKNKMILVGYGNSLFYMIVGTTLNIALTIMAAYPLSRKDFKMRNVIMFLFVFTMMFNAGMIPNYLAIRDYGLIDTRWAMILPKGIVVYNLIVTRTYFQTTIPNELLEASKIEGCDDFNFIWRIVIPLSKPILAVITLFYAITHWNSFFHALIYLNDANKYPLQLVLRDILIANSVDATMLGDDVDELIRKQGLQELLKYSLIVVASVPLLILYPFIQKYFVQGIMVGSVKG